MPLTSKLSAVERHTQISSNGETKNPEAAEILNPAQAALELIKRIESEVGSAICNVGDSLILFENLAARIVRAHYVCSEFRHVTHPGTIMNQPAYMAAIGLNDMLADVPDHPDPTPRIPDPAHYV